MTKSNKYYDQSYFQERDVLDIRIAEAVRLLMVKHNFRSILDVGCGSGWLVKYLAERGFQVRGCDLADSALKAADKKTRQLLVKSSATKLPFAKNSFDLVVSVSVVEHLDRGQVDKFLKETRRVLKPGGVVFLVTPNYASPFRLIQGQNWFGYSDPTHINFYTAVSLSKQLRGAGFDQIRTMFRTVYWSSFDWDLPYLRTLPKPGQALAAFLLFSTPLALIRNTVWMSGRKS